jgi:hypothetical protein
VSMETWGHMVPGKPYIVGDVWGGPPCVLAKTTSIREDIRR